MTSHSPTHSFRAAVEAHDLDAVTATLAPDVVLHSPVTFHPYAGRETVAALLRLIAGTFEDFRYTDEFRSSDGAQALVFRARVGDRELEGLDLLRLNANGLIGDLTAMVRPLSGLVALAQAIAPKAEAAGLKAAA
jgi:limonene-1,2-epoxide hydrolase